MNQVKQTKKEISDLRNAFRIQYTKFKDNYNEIGKRMYDLVLQADELLSFMERLNKLELEGGEE
jgi:hypothetical protein